MTSSRNLRLYPLYAICLNGFFWFPVFFLYLTDRVGLEQTLLLESIYYAAVVTLEVPSGWLSDRLGRRVALRASMALLSIAYVFFFFGETFWMLAAAQILLGMGYAFNSGTDTAFHYDSLAALGREDEYADREERIASLSFLTVAVSAIVGGLLGAIELRYAYAAAFVASAAGFAITLAFTRPEPTEAKEAERLDRQLLACARDLRDPVLAWFFAFSVLMTLLVHVPYHLYQPYLQLLEFDMPGIDDLPTPVSAGAHACAAMLVAAALSSRSVRLARRVGVHVVVLGATLLSFVILGIAGTFLHPLVAIVLLFRSAPRALTQAAVNGAVTPRVPRHRRASFLSMNSLAGRLAFSSFLAALSLFVGAGAPDWGDISKYGWAGAVIAAFGFVGLALTSRAVSREHVLAVEPHDE